MINHPTKQVLRKTLHFEEGAEGKRMEWKEG